jgi:hypothetical protein
MKDYFDGPAYMDKFEGEPNYEFAKALYTKSAQFINFCDDRLDGDEDLTNYKMYDAISNAGEGWVESPE